MGSVGVRKYIPTNQECLSLASKSAASNLTLNFIPAPCPKALLAPRIEAGKGQYQQGGGSRTISDGVGPLCICKDKGPHTKPNENNTRSNPISLMISPGIRLIRTSPWPKMPSLVAFCWGLWAPAPAWLPVARTTKRDSGNVSVLDELKVQEPGK